MPLKAKLMKFSIKFIQLCFILIFLNACKTSINKEPLIIDSDEEVSEINSSQKNKMEIKNMKVNLILFLG